jgi:hypothetical protein
MGHHGSPGQKVARLPITPMYISPLDCVTNSAALVKALYLHRAAGSVDEYSCEYLHFAVKHDAAHTDAMAQAVKDYAHGDGTSNARAHMTMSFSSHSCSFAAILSALDRPLTSPVASNASLQ